MNKESTPLLKTKLYVPPRRPNLVSRPRLANRLGEALCLQHRLTLISARAGSGKTTLVSEWLHQQERPSAWLSLDENDNDPNRFISYLVGALRPLNLTISHTGLESHELPPAEALITGLVNDIAAGSTPFILVLDDYHLIQNDWIHKAIGFLIEHLPPEMHLVLTTRVDPPLPLAQLRARGQLTEIRDRDLLFTSSEVVQFLNEMMALDLLPMMVATIEQRTEGWIAGLQMAAISARGHQQEGDLDAFIEAFGGTNRFILDYLTEEVLNQQSQPLQDFLIETSILDRMCGGLCDAVRSRGALAPDSQSILVELERTNLFVISLDDERRWYRYHHLFADLLRQSLTQAYPDQIPSLHLRASQWYEQAGLTEPAVQHALAAQAFGHAATLVERFAPAIIQGSEVNRLLSWIDRLPDDEVHARPLLALYYVWGLFLNGKIRQAVAQLKALEAKLATNEAKQTPEVQAHLAAMRANLLRESGDFPNSIALSQQALAYFPEEDTLLRARIKLNLSFAYYLQGEFEPAHKLLTEIIAADQTDQRMLNTLSAMYIETQLLLAQGALGQAMQLCQDGLELIDRRGWKNLPAAGFLYVAYGGLLYVQNELTTAMEYLDWGIKLGQAGGIPHISITGYVWQAWLRQTQGDVRGSQESIRSALQLVQQYQMSRFWPIPPAACWNARLCIAQGNLEEANRWAHVNGLRETYLPITYLYEVDNLTLARLLIVQGHLEAAEGLLLQLHQAAASAGRNGSLIEILILQAITLEVQKRSEEALLALGRAFDLGKPEGFVRVFLDEGSSMISLLRRAVTKGLHIPYALHLLNVSGVVAADPQPLIEALSGRELEVLQLLAEGLSNKEIADRLFVAPGTIKQHLKNISRKLDVNGRMQAVRRGRELRLL